MPRKQFSKLEELNLQEILTELKEHPRHGDNVICECDKSFIIEIMERLIKKVEALEKEGGK